MSRRITYKEGDWFGVPLQNGEYAVGLIARCPPEGKILYGYFFGPRRPSLPSLEDLEWLSSKDATAVKFFGDLKLLNKAWPIIGRIEPWDRTKWPMRSFARADSVSGKTYKIEYADDGPNR